MKLLSKKQMTVSNMNSRQIREAKKQGNTIRQNQNNFTQRVQTNNEDLSKQLTNSYLKNSSIGEAKR